MNASKARKAFKLEERMGLILLIVLVILRKKLINIGAKVISKGRYVTLQMAEVAVSREMFADILMLVARLRAPAPA